MTPWLKTRWSAARDSLWFLPAILTLAAAALAATLLVIDQRMTPWAGEPPWWLHRGGADGARTVLNVITGSLITVTGVVFSVTIVAVQLASTQFTPRVMRNLSSDRGNQVVLGIFIGTFTFALLVLRTVRDAGGGTRRSCRGWPYRYRSCSSSSASRHSSTSSTTSHARSTSPPSWIA